MRRFAMCLLLAVVAAAGQSASASAATAPAWSIVTLPFPSAFEAGSAYNSDEAGPGFQIQAYNVGGAPTSGTFSVVVSLPATLNPVSGHSAFGFYGPEAVAAKLSCSTSGHTITCAGGGATAVGPGEEVSVVVPVEVAPTAAGTVLGKAKIEGGGAGTISTSTATPISATPSAFGFLSGVAGLSGLATQEDGSADTGAGTHPYQFTVGALGLTTNSNSPGNSELVAAGGGVHEVKAQLPAGMVVNPQATPRCKESELHTGTAGCPLDSQIGTVALTLSLAQGLGSGAFIRPLYNMITPPGYPAEFGFEIIEGTYAHLLGSVSSDGTYTLAAKSPDILARVAVGAVRPTLWGDPSAESHDAQRGECLLPVRSRSTCPPTERSEKAFVTMPAACSGPLVTSAQADSWLDPGTFVGRTYESTDAVGNPVGIDGCAGLRFEPTISAQSTTDLADSPSGLEFDLHQPQQETAAEPATAPLKNTTVTLPEGMTLNPAAANGREACTAAQVGLASAVGATPIRYREEPAHCRNASKVGIAQVITPVLDHKLSGSIYLAKPFDNPFGSLLAVYLVVEDEQSGIIAKLAGEVDPDPVDGQLVTTFSESPQLPLEDVHLSFFGGPRAALTTPLTCGTKDTTGQLTSWSSSAAVAIASSFAITASPGGGCPASEAQAPNSPSLSAGTTTPFAGAYSPFVLHLSRPDGSQRIVSVDTTLPQGLVGRLTGIPYCSDGQIAAAEARRNPEEGKAELISSSCPSASEVGTVEVGAGSGEGPIYVTGHAYLAGPYKGAPLSLAIITPAVAGPFDLGVVVVRVALEVNPETAQITAKSDPFPTILHGIPLDVRSIAIDLNRPNFTLNPTNCVAQAITATVMAPTGSKATSANRFGVEGCDKLAFKPKVSISLKGGTKRVGHPALKAVVTMPSGDAGIARAQVGLPHALFLDQANLNNTCTRPVLLAGGCPASTVYGHAKAWTPLLEKPLEGPVYLVGGYGYKLPALVAELKGQIRILLKGRVDTTDRGGIRNTFELVPDAPVSRFVLQMKGGKKYSLLENSEDLCAAPRRASARFVAQNGRVSQVHPKISVRCGKKPVKKSRDSGSHRSATP
jgi:hypothetical protein